MTYLTPEEIAKQVRLNVVTVRRACARGEIDADRFAGKWRISEEAFEDWRKKGREPAGVIEPRAKVSTLPWGRSLRAIEGGHG